MMPKSSSLLVCSNVTQTTIEQCMFNCSTQKETLILSCIKCQRPVELHGMAPIFPHFLQKKQGTSQGRYHTMFQSIFMNPIDSNTSKISCPQYIHTLWVGWASNRVKDLMANDILLAVENSLFILTWPSLPLKTLGSKPHNPLITPCATFCSKVTYPPPRA